MKLWISATQERGFCRCGRKFSYEGELIDIDDFSEEQWEILKGEKRLRISEPTEEQLEGAGAPDELHARIAEVISTLPGDAFQQDGKPKLDALNEALKGEFGRIKAADRDAAWEALLENGFEVPSDE